jgi:hypothetical protein
MKKLNAAIASGIGAPVIMSTVSALIGMAADPK